jgi:hypothetical protein
MSCNNQTKNDIPSDSQMIEYFSGHKSDFEQLSLWVQQDKLDHFPLFAQEEKSKIALDISEDRAKEYTNLMAKLSIARIWHPFKLEGRNTIVFTYFEKGNATWEVEKGFEYRPNDIVVEDTNFIENDLWNEALKYDNATLYKKIDDNWNLFLTYDR